MGATTFLFLANDKNMVERLRGMWILGFLFFLLLPFQFALGVMDGVDLAVSRVGALLIGLIFLAERLRSGSWILPPPRDTFFFMGLLSLMGLSSLWAEEPAWTLRKVLFLLSFLPIWFFFADLFSRKGSLAIRGIGRGFFFGSVAGAGVALIQFISQFIFSLDQILHFWLSRVYPLFLGEAFAQAVATHPSLLVNIAGKTILRATGMFPDPHVAAFYFGMAIPFGLWLGMMAPREKKMPFFLGVGILFLADLGTFSRGGYVGLLAMLLFFGAFYLYHQREKIPWRQQKKVVLVALAVFILALSIPLVRNRLMETFSITEGSNSARIALWKEAMVHIGERPLLGYGLGNYPLKVLPSAQYRDPIYIHNIYLDIWAELGIIGLLFFLGIFLLPVGIFFFRGSLASIALPATLALVLFLAHSFFENTLFSVHVFPVLLLLTAIVSWYNRKNETN